jgi:hypothetical protein
MIVTVEAFDRRIGVGVVIHLDEPEASAPAGLPIAEHLRRSDLAILLEQLLEILGSHRVGQVSDIKPFRHRIMPARAGSPPSTIRRRGARTRHNPTASAPSGFHDNPLIIRPTTRRFNTKSNHSPWKIVESSSA